MGCKSFYLGLAALLLASSACSGGQPDAASDVSEQNDGAVLYAETFDSYEDGERPPDWWMEGGEDVFVREGRLHIESDPETERGPGYVATVWNQQNFSGDIQVEFDARVTASSQGVNNINFFLMYSHPSADSTLYETRSGRSDGSYDYYHELNGYIFTFVRPDQNNNEARFRMRRCPGFELIDENYAYDSRKGKTYRVTITKQGDSLSYAVDGDVYLRATDEKYNWTEGLIGLRTFHTDLWIDNLRITRLASPNTASIQ